MRGIGAIVLVLGVVAAGCAGAPGLADTTRILNEDGATLSRIDLAAKHVASAEDAGGCPAGSRRAVYTLTGDLASGGTAAGVVSALASEFQRMGYQEGEGPGDRFGVNVSVLEKTSLGITFTVTLRADHPNVEITGRTGCHTS
ncbi:hypothetical protein GCM10009677_64490 [Sphaerisporangium rubeum]|uniref:Lipoprotein n=1 Tax=Sphaerisporangium rubeum TaxID=321317 RepID=A0A7X0IED5_9ACTN|nr:hypothetical protein [Sphaerisporangium rubeum]MBB6472423.1 hypothetical protein [Sphaerisporangium rubeum]